MTPARRRPAKLQVCARHASRLAQSHARTGRCFHPSTRLAWLPYHDRTGRDDDEILSQRAHRIALTTPTEADRWPEVKLDIGEIVRTRMSPKDMYLVLYNLSCMVGWFAALALGVQSLLKDNDLAKVWAAA